MKLQFKFIAIVTTLLLVAGCSSSKETSGSSSGPKPSWLIQRPVDSNYYTGIGSAANTGNASEAQKSAQDLALADIASQISVKVTSDIVTTIIESGAMTADEYMATARSQAVADLEGHELVDTWSDARNHYAYYRLSKAKYAAIQAQKRAEALALATDFYAKSQTAHGLGDFDAELKALLQAFTPLIPYLNEALNANVNGEPVIISNEINQSLFQILSDIKVTPNTSTIKAKLGQAIRDQIRIQVRDTNGKALANVPLSLTFAKGAGELTRTIQTDENGVADLPLIHLTAADKLQILSIRIDPDQLIPEGTSPIVTGLVNSVPKVATQIMIEVTNPTIFLSTSEIYNGKPMAQPRIEPQLKNHFIENGFHFVDGPAQADWFMELQATATPGTEYSGLYTVFSDVSVSVRDRTSAKEIYKNSISRVKGIDLNYAAAANKSLSNAAGKLTEDILPQILASLK
ncbi:MAG: LPP20 family lipoprotein [Candidatus Marinimicrobia bacterium]|nr:LPP20 family lipoprotein [Candidatus Neomarinimicrobiota bacterium]MCF7904567.1 LPP20 family lipoprotein [Candidatus Neomarinimicrobiota bacterium]